MEPHASAVPEKRRDYILPASIIAAAILIAGSLLYTRGAEPKGFVPLGTDSVPETGELAGVDGPAKMKPVSADDHIVGSLDAPVVVVEYSDLECPFCKRFHATMQEAVRSYGGRVAWVYRHFPLAQLHSKAPKEAEATECAAEQGGNAGFWRYTDRLMEVTPANNGLDPAELPKIASAVGLDRAKFEACLASGKHASKVASQAVDAVASGGQGTPYSVVITKSGKTAIIPGALPFTSEDQSQPSVQSIIDSVLR